MGDTAGDDMTVTNFVKYETPLQTVTLSPYYIDKYEVTNEQMRRVLQWALEHHYLGVILQDGNYVVYGSGHTLMIINTYGDPLALPLNHISFNGSQFVIASGRENDPCAGVTWYGAIFYCNYLTEMEGLRVPCYNPDTHIGSLASSGYRLPTEAEWEFAARGGSSNRYACGEYINYALANYYGHPDMLLSKTPRTFPVGSFPPNEYGLYDMTGNVKEWCHNALYLYTLLPIRDPEDCSTNVIHVLRGGSFLDIPYYCRTSYRTRAANSQSHVAFGFRTAISK